jgi:hypothetical protein
MGIAGRAIATMIASSGLNDVLRIYNTTQADRVAFNLAFIGADFDGVLNTPFEQSYMRALYAYGHARGRAGNAWVSTPPFLVADPAAAS